MTDLRDRLARMARKGLDRIEKHLPLPPGYKAVVVITDNEGEWVGVAATCGDQYAFRILRAALSGGDFKRHPSVVKASKG